MTILQNTRRTAFAMFRRGFSVSDAALYGSETLQGLIRTGAIESKLSSHCNEFHPLERETRLHEDRHPT